MKILIQGDVFHLVPTQADSESQATIAQHIERSRLLGDQGRLALGQNDDASDKADLGGDPRHETEQDKGFMKRILECVRAFPTTGSVGVCAQDMVVGQDVSEAQAFGGLSVIAHRNRVGWVFSLRVDEAELNGHGWGSQYQAPIGAGCW